MLSDDDHPKPRRAHEIGCDLSLMSAAEIGERIAVLRAEIARLETEMATKAASRGAAEGLFKTK